MKCTILFLDRQTMKSLDLSTTKDKNEIQTVTNKLMCKYLFLVTQVILIKPKRTMSLTALMHCSIQPAKADNLQYA